MKVRILSKLLSHIHNYPDINVLVVDDNSPDGTSVKLKK